MTIRFHKGFHKTPFALAAAAALCTSTLVMAQTKTKTATPAVASVAKTPGKYVAGDFHNHTTCSDGSISMQKLVQKSTMQWGLDWFVQAGHGGNATAIARWWKTNRWPRRCTR